MKGQKRSIHIMSVCTIFNIYLFGICVLSPFICSFASPQLTPKDDHCVMYHLCEGEEYGDVPCVYNGSAKPLVDTDYLSTGMTPVDILQHICPELVNDENPHVCCSSVQLEDFYHQMVLVEKLGFSRCQSCLRNFQKLLCTLYCNPSQSRYMNVVRKDVNHEDEEVVAEVNFYVSKSFADALYDSCKDLQDFTPGSNLMDRICGHWGRALCNAERWTKFMGSTPDEGSYSPFKTNYILTTKDVFNTEDGVTFYSMNATTAKCSESPGPGLEKCNCSDCRDSCTIDIDMLQLPVLEPTSEPTSEPSTIFMFDGPSEVAIVTFSFLFIIVFIILMF